MRVAGEALRWTEDDLRADLALLRERTPLVHCLTNAVTIGLVANVLLAAGASPIMVPAPEEAGEAADAEAAVLVNVGTITVAQIEAIRVAVAAARRAGRPWVLDPVGVGALSLRSELCAELLSQRPAVVRGNASEVLALAGRPGGGRGVDSTDDPAQALPAAQELAARTGAIVAVSGPADYITDGGGAVLVSGGDPMLTRVTGMGDAQGALISGFLGAGVAPLRAAIAGSAALALAAERAVPETRGPGTFAAAVLDELALL
jgi:hydroxyethylthiazole kinase